MNAGELLAQMVSGREDKRRRREIAVTDVRKFLEFGVEVHGLPAERWTVTARVSKEMNSTKAKRRTVATITDLEILLLIDKRVAMAPDSDGRISSAGTFNALVSNETVEGKLFYKDAYPQYIGVVVWQLFNDSPGASGGGFEGMGRLIITIPDDVEPAKRYPLPKQKIVAEAAGIFAWAYGMTADDMTAALANSGEVTASASASIEHALDDAFSAGDVSGGR